MFAQPKTIKLVKIRSACETRKFGIGATNLIDLLSKSCRLLKIALPGARVCLYDDGTELTEDYFRFLPLNAELVLLAKGQHWKGFLSDIQRLLDLDHFSAKLIDEAKNFVTDKLSAKRRKVLGDLLLCLKDRSDIEDRGDDNEWFQGIESRFKTKSAYMRHNCENRIRGYLKEVDAFTRSITSTKQRQEYKKVFEDLTAKLKKMGYNGSYFDRTSKHDHCLCTPQGWFSCQGAYDEEECDFMHSINPYGNRESRILFSTWNLDHMIEKKRTILPALVEALEGRKSGDINVDYFYRLLFTVSNLRLVHIVCHKKGAHNLTCDKRKIYKQGKRK